MNPQGGGTLSCGRVQHSAIRMRPLKAITEYINKRRDETILNCLRSHEVMAERELQLRTGIRPKILQARLQILVEKKLLTQHGTDERSIWRIHHP
jgi:DNA-binding HxlR family transcriptional regulator